MVDSLSWGLVVCAGWRKEQQRMRRVQSLCKQRQTKPAKHRVKAEDKRLAAVPQVKTRVKRELSSTS
jgi:hypothetical protein